MVVHVAENVRILARPRPVSDAVRAAVVERLRDALRAERLARVHGHIHVVPHHVIERLAVRLRRVVLLRAREVEADHPAAVVGDGDLRELEGEARAQVPDAADDRAGLDPVPAPRPLEAGRHRLD